MANKDREKSRSEPKDKKESDKKDKDARDKKDKVKKDKGKVQAPPIDTLHVACCTD